MVRTGKDSPGLVVREPEGSSELRALEELQLEVWGFEPLDVVPAAHLRAVQHAGGMVLAAYDEAATLGFAYGFPALPHDGWESGVGVHSHMVAVRPGARGAGVGRTLKWAQRSWCLERGIHWMTWTFDPIQAGNARLNVHHLGASSHEYLVDFYGAMPGGLGGGQPSDRLLAFWDLQTREVAVRGERFALGLEPEPEPLPSSSWVLRASPEGEPEAAAPPEGGLALRVAVPRDATRLLREDPALALRWRRAVREAMAPLLGSGYVVTAFDDGAYLVERPPRASAR